MIIVVIILIIIFCIIYFNTKKIEGYDDRIINTNLQDCAHLCKTIHDCYGFAYDDKHKICFPAQKIIDNQTNDFIFKKDISFDKHIICNKFIPIITPTNNPSTPERKSNSMYTCSDKKAKPVLYYENDNKMTHIDNGQNLDFILNVDDYKVALYNWPSGNIVNNTQDAYILETNNIQPIQQDVSDLSVYLSNNYISNSERQLIRPQDEIYKILETNIEHLTNTPKQGSSARSTTRPTTRPTTRSTTRSTTRPTTRPVGKTTTRPTTRPSTNNQIQKQQEQVQPIKQEVQPQIGNQQQEQQIQPQIGNQQQEQQIQQQTSNQQQEQEQEQEQDKTKQEQLQKILEERQMDIPITNTPNSNVYYDVDFVGKNISKIYKIYDDYNNGITNNCVQNITQKECLIYCKNNDKCVGVEWNPLYGQNKSVCCPYTGMGNFEQRDKYNKLGKFFEKTHDVYSKNNIYMVYDNN